MYLLTKKKNRHSKRLRTKNNLVTKKRTLKTAGAKKNWSQKKTGEKKKTNKISHLNLFILCLFLLHRKKNFLLWPVFSDATFSKLWSFPKQKLFWGFLFFSGRVFLPVLFFFFLDWVGGFSQLVPFFEIFTKQIRWTFRHCCWCWVQLVHKGVLGQSLYPPPTHKTLPVSGQKKGRAIFCGRGNEINKSSHRSKKKGRAIFCDQIPRSSGLISRYK